MNCEAFNAAEDALRQYFCHGYAPLNAPNKTFQGAVIFVIYTMSLVSLLGTTSVVYLWHRQHRQGKDFFADGSYSQHKFTQALVTVEMAWSVWYTLFIATCVICTTNPDSQQYKRSTQFSVLLAIARMMQLGFSCNAMHISKSASNLEAAAIATIATNILACIVRGDIVRQAYIKHRSQFYSPSPSTPASVHEQGAFGWLKSSCAAFLGGLCAESSGDDAAAASLLDQQPVRSNC